MSPPEYRVLAVGPVSVLWRRGAVWVCVILCGLILPLGLVLLATGTVPFGP
ncbi:hypothetical protein [Pseudogemmobacter sonorensis]|uniref:hypothetical protein n=1 Tax=Pseudogemmobacter sonorensis TaxID=2989681 RepID=UPI0036AC6F99